MKNFIVAVLTIIFTAVTICSCAKKEPDISTGKNEVPTIIIDTESSGEDTQTPSTTDKPTENTQPTIGGQVTVTYNPKVVNSGKTFTGLAPLSSVQYTLNDPNNTRGLSTTRSPFSFGVAKNGTPHDITVNNQKVFDGYDLNALVWDNKTQGAKVLYLTFDCGYKYGNLTERILDTLKEKNVKAAFFCTLDYLEEAPETVARMIEEGHIVGNHSTTHPDCTTISREELAKELLGVDNYMRVNFGYSTKYFRFPTGAFSQSTLDVVDNVNHRSVFWSVAHADWDPVNQPGVETSYSTVTSRLHPGAVILLHSTSPDNADILGRVIDYAIANGYEFRSLDQYEYWN